MTVTHKTILSFLKIMGFAMIVYLVTIKLGGEKKVAKIAAMILIGAVAYSFRIKYKYNLIQKSKFRIKHYGIATSLICLFLVNNLIQKYYLQVDFDYQKDMIYYMFGYFVITSTSEELLYRGYLQPKIDENQIRNGQISKGIIVSSILMVTTHFGFFYTMPFLSALPSVVLVGLFSLGMGLIMKETQNLKYPIILHILINWLHFFIQK